MTEQETTRSFSIVQRVITRFKNRPDSEHEQSIVRIAITVIVLIYLGLSSLFGESSESVKHGLIILCLFLMFSTSILVAIAINPGISVTRRIICMLGDMGMISYLLYYYGQMMTPLYVVYLWVSSGYGLRYGNRYLAASTALAAIGFILVMRYNAEWREDPTIGWSLWIGLIVLPMYIASLLAKLSRALDAAKSANEAKSRFLANMSHEIRTPINGVIGLLELLSVTPLAEKQKSLVHGAQSSAAMLLHLINDVLDISKIEAGRISIEYAPFDLHALVNGVVGLFDNEARKKNLILKRNIDPACPYWLIGDELHLRQVLVNLVGNAVKFTEQGWVEVRVEACSITSERVQFNLIVEDTGIGISEEAKSYIFDPFRQEDERINRRFGGTGLGMSIAQQLVDLMEGELTASSEPGKGSRFTLNMECQRASIPTSAQYLRFPAGIRVVSSDSALIETLREWLGEWEVSCKVDLGIALQMDIDETVVLVDARCLKDGDKSILGNSGLTSRDLILITDNPQEWQEDGKFDYINIQPLPLERERLYSVLHSLQIASFDETELQPNQDKAPVKPLITGHILVAEDNKINQRVTCGFLEQDGHKVVVVDNGDAALDQLEAQEFDLAIVDMMMPGHGGLDVVKIFRHTQGSRTGMPFIVLTANVSKEVQTACESIGVKYLSKPLRGVDLKAEVQQILMPRKGEGYETKVESVFDILDAPILEESIYQELVELLGEGSRLESIVQDFYDDIEQLIKEMDLSVSSSDWQTVADNAHGLKSAAVGIGAKQLAAAARKLEYDMRKIPPRAQKDPLAGINAAYRAVRSELQSRITISGDSSGLS
ncbi:MAG: ATP-binding protein [Candidatus Thiodiazotropha endolucinida]